MSKIIAGMLLIICAIFTSSTSFGAIIDPENYILENGYQSTRKGDDGKTDFYSYKIQLPTAELSAYEQSIEALPKDESIFQVCDLMRGGVKSMLIEQRGIAIDVAVRNYGYSGQTIACILKYMIGNQVGTQIIL